MSEHKMIKHNFCKSNVIQMKLTSQLEKSVPEFHHIFVQYYFVPKTLVKEQMLLFQCTKFRLKIWHYLKIFSCRVSIPTAKWSTNVLFKDLKQLTNGILMLFALLIKHPIELLFSNHEKLLRDADQSWTRCDRIFWTGASRPSGIFLSLYYSQIGI